MTNSLSTESHLSVKSPYGQLAFTFDFFQRSIKRRIKVGLDISKASLFCIGSIKIHLGFVAWILLSQPSQAQVVFTTNSLPSQVGEYNCSYFSTNVEVTPFVNLITNANTPPGPGAGGQSWDFSQPKQPYQTISRTDIIAATNGGNSSYFPSATYAEQYTIEPADPIGWQYYGFASGITNSGRIYYGLDEPVDGASPEAVFIPPCVDIPSTVQLNQTWSEKLSWMTLYYQFILVSNYMSSSAIVDAFGTLVLPSIGAVPALRVHETHSYALSEISNPPIPLDLHTNQFYYWLVPGLGVAAQITLLGNNALNPIVMPYTNTVFCFYFANYFTNNFLGKASIFSFPTNLSIQNATNSIVLTWQHFTNYSKYRIDFAELLDSNTWSSLSYVTGNSWTDSTSSVQRFYRVVGVP